MKLDLEDHAVIIAIVTAIRVGALKATGSMFKKNLEWTQQSVAMLVDYAKWNHQATRQLAEAHKIDVGSAPCIKVSTPPPTEPGWNQLAEEITDHGGKKKT